VAGPVIVHTLA
jgi:ABC-type phosphate/phosphonate transport system ATPase subunit